MNGRDGSFPTSTRLWFALLRRLGHGLRGRRITTRDVAVTVGTLHARPEPSPWSLARARDVEIVLHDVAAPGFSARELVVACETLSLGSTVTATGVSVTATMSAASLRELGEDDGSRREVEVVDGELRSRWLPGVEMALRPEVAADRLRFVPVALLTPAGRWPAPRWLPAGTAPPPDLPAGLRLLDIAIVGDAAVLRAGTDQWTASLRDRSRLRELLGAAAATDEPDPLVAARA